MDVISNKTTNRITPPYYAVIFTARLSGADQAYQDTAQRMRELVEQQDGYLGMESVHESGVEITISYWKNEQALLQWKKNLEHKLAQEKGRTLWYKNYTVRVARVERDYGFQ